MAWVGAWLQAAGIATGFVVQRLLSEANRRLNLPRDNAGVALVIKWRASASGSRRQV